MRIFFICLAACFALTANAQTYSVETVPNTKLINNSYVSNPDAILQAATVDQINQQLASLEASSTAQIAVVMLTSIGDNDIFDFAQRLFKTWGLGQADKDNGLLILYVQDKRTIRFHTGYGLEGVLPDAVCKQIQREYMVPSFKEGDIDGGMLAGIDAVAKILLNPTSVDEIKSESDDTWTSASWMYFFSFFFGILWFTIGLIMFFVKRANGFSDSKGFTKTKLNAFMSSWQWLLFCYLIPITGLIYLAYLEDALLYIFTIYGYLLLLRLYAYGRIMYRANQSIKNEDYPAVTKFLQDQGSWTWSAIFFPIPFVFLAWYLNNRKKTIRHFPRSCRQCQSPMRLLSEKAEDKYLNDKMKLEEDLKSIDYDVWLCTSCTAVAIWPFLNEKTSYSVCPNCQAMAYHTSRRTLKEATYTKEGSKEVVESCSNCNHKVVSKQTIPILVSSSSFDSHSSSSWSSSSSSDSGGSWGGGDSGGGGASSSW